VQVATVVLFVVDGSAHILSFDTVNALVGVGFTVTKALVIGEMQVGVGAAPGLLTIKEIVLTVGVPVVLVQLTCQGPAVFPGAVIHPLQFQVYTALGVAAGDGV
jgi:hypothetical protein